jgi:hypothetical protein
LQKVARAAFFAVPARTPLTVPRAAVEILDSKPVPQGVTLMESKLISIDFNVMKAKLKSTRDSAISGVLNKGIELSKKQLQALEKAKRNLG